MPSKPPPPPEEHPIRGRPVSYLTAHGKWPDGPFKDKTPTEIRLAQAITRRLEEALARRKGSRDDAAAKAHLAPATLHKLLYGTSWGRVPTIARLERILGTRLWGDEHHRPPPRYYITSGEWPDGRLHTKAPPEGPPRSGGRPKTRTRMREPPLGVYRPGSLRHYSHPARPMQRECSGVTCTPSPRLERFLKARLWGDEHQKRRPFTPRGYLDVGVWPEGRLHTNAPPEARLAQAMVLRLHIACSKILTRKWSPNKPESPSESSKTS